MIVFIGSHQMIPQGACGIILEKSSDGKHLYCEFDITGMDVLWTDTDNPTKITAEVKVSEVEQIQPGDYEIPAGAVVISAIAKNPIGAIYAPYIGQVGTPVTQHDGVLWLEMENGKDMPFVLSAVRFSES